MNRISISFVIPYYKVPLPLLRRCIDSVRALGGQTDWEIQLIDDGTPGDEAKQYLDKLKDSRIHYHVQENGGLSVARNNGWTYSTKEYIQFLDADDYLFRTPALQAIQLLDKEHPDLLAFDFRKVYDDGMHDIPIKRIPVRFRGEGTAYMLKNNLHGTACGYIFRREAAGNVRFTPGIYHEDEDFTPRLWLHMQHIIVTTLPVYAYHQRQDSIVNDPDEQKISQRYHDLTGILIRLRDESRQQPSDRSRALRRRTDMVALAMIYTLMKESPDDTFLKGILQRMGEEGFYPLPSGHWSCLYVLFRLFTFRPSFVCLLSRRVFRRKRG